MVLNFISYVENLPLPAPVTNVIHRLCVLYSLNRISVNSGYFLAVSTNFVLQFAFSIMIVESETTSVEVLIVLL